MPTGPQRIPSTTEKVLSGKTLDSASQTRTGPGEANWEPSGGAVGRFQLRERLGGGGWGVVWRAWDPGLQREVALKLIRSDDPAVHERFAREARAAAGLRHPGIVTVHDVGIEAGRPWLAMEVLAGGTLEARLGTASESGPIRGESLRELVAMLAEVASAVGYAHGQNVVHRDLKPANVLIDEAGRARVADFGLAWALEEDPSSRLTSAGEVLGTPPYMSPEQTIGRPQGVGPPADVWALGVVLYRILTGAFPFLHDCLGPLFAAIREADPKPPHACADGVPEDLAAVCLKALEKDPKRRFAAGDLAAELSRWLRGEPTETRPAARTARMRRWFAARWAFVAVGVALAAAAASVALERRRAEEDQVRAALAGIAADMKTMRERERHLVASPEAKDAMAEQFLPRIEAVLGDGPLRGEAYSWRGKVACLTGGEAAGGTGFDRGCREAPERAPVWALRGMHDLDRYAGWRPLPAPILGAAGIRFPAPRPETVLEAALRVRALADLDRMLALGDREFGPDFARHGRAIAALWSPEPGGAEAASRLLAGAALPQARYVRGLALFQLGRFAESASELDAAVAAWPTLAPALHARGLALAAAAFAETAAGRDPGELRRRALADLDATLERAPEWADAWCDRGLCRLQAHDDERRRGGTAGALLADAVADFGRALELSPDAVVALANRATAFRALGLIESAAGGDPRVRYRMAIADLDRGLAREPSSVLLLADRGAILRSVGQAESARGGDPRATLREALAAYDAACAQAPGDPVALVGRATTQTLLGWAEGERDRDPTLSWRAAEQDCAEALRRLPGFSEALRCRGELCWRRAEWTGRHGGDPRGGLSAAVDAFTAALASAREPAGILDGRGSAFSDLGLAQSTRGQDPGEAYRKAIADFAAAVARQPRYALALTHSSAAWRRLAQAEESAGADPSASLEQARKAADAALAISPGLADAWADRALAGWRSALRETARREDARPTLQRSIADADEALRRCPGFAKALVVRGAAWADLGRVRSARGDDPRDCLRKAIADADAVLHASPGHAIARFNRGNARIELARAETERGGNPTAHWQAAEADLRSATAGEPRAWLNLGTLLRGQRRLDEAIAAFAAAERAVPGAAAWARSRIEEAERTRAELERVQPWLSELRRAAVRDGSEKALAAMAHTLAALSEAERRVAEQDPTLRRNRATAHYNLACMDAATDAEAAFRHLDEAFRNATWSRAQFAGDPDLAPLHGDPRWPGLLAACGE